MKLIEIGQIVGGVLSILTVLSIIFAFFMKWLKTKLEQIDNTLSKHEKKFEDIEKMHEQQDKRIDDLSQLTVRVDERTSLMMKILEEIKKEVNSINVKANRKRKREGKK